MKKMMLLFLLFCSGISSSQTLPRYNEIKLDNAGDYKAADTFALLASNFLLSTPLQKDNIERRLSLAFLVKWMAGTPDYSFFPDAEILRGNDDLMEIYLACLTKYCLENKALSKNNKLVKLNAAKLLLDFCGDSNNNITITGYLKKLAEANRRGELEKVL